MVAVLLYICCAFIPNELLKLKKKRKIIVSTRELLVYIILFIMVILSVFRIIPLDYALIATFCVFFIFSGNIARILAIKQFISDIVVKNTLIAGGRILSVYK